MLLKDIIWREMLRLSIRGYNCLVDGNLTGAEITVNEMSALLDEADSKGIAVDEAATAERDQLKKDLEFDKKLKDLGEQVESFKRRYA